MIYSKDVTKEIGGRQKAHKVSKLYHTRKQCIKFHKQQCRKVGRMIKRAKLENEDRVANAAKISQKYFLLM